MRADASRVAAAEIERVGLLGRARRANTQMPFEKAYSSHPSHDLRRRMAMVEVDRPSVEAP
jgi:hypothetical protein